MNNKKIRQRALGLLAGAAVVAAFAPAATGHAAGPRTRSDAGAGVGVLRLADEGISEPGSLDPVLFDGQALVVDNTMYNGLLKLNAHLLPVPDLASGYTVSRDGLTYTFMLRSGARFSDGAPVTAPDAAWSLTRMLAPQLSNGGAIGYFSMIAGAVAYNNGKARDVSGIRALDARRVRVTLAYRAGYFPDVMTMMFASILEKKAVLRYGNAYNTKWTEHAVGAGPFALRSWTHNQSVSVAPNTYYYGGRPRLTRIDIPFIASPDTAYNAYQTSAIDVMGVNHFPSDRIGSVMRHQDFHGGPKLEVDYLTLNEKKAPFNNALVRLAFSQAVDRDLLARAAPGTVSPTDRILPPGLPGYDASLRVPGFNVAQARADLVRAGYAGGRGLPKITYTYSATGADEDRRARLLQAMWKQYLGVNVALNSQELSAYNNTLTARNFQIGLIQSGADYPDPQDFLSLSLVSGGAGNNGGYSDHTFDSLVRTADSIVGDNARRYRLYAQAEGRALDQAAVIPLANERNTVVVKPWVHNFVVTALPGLVPDWASVSVSGH